MGKQTHGLEHSLFPSLVKTHYLDGKLTTRSHSDNSSDSSQSHLTSNLPRASFLVVWVSRRISAMWSVTLSVGFPTNCSNNFTGIELPKVNRKHGFEAFIDSKCYVAGFGQLVSASMTTRERIGLDC